ncbi:MAG: hypothetical protein JWQ67_704 [Marmoricola sp.]|nr:hypothetical protein [Marmoricola sp.]
MRSHLRFASAFGAATLSVLAIAPAMAAAPIAQAGANAVTLSIAGNGQGSGDVTATHDGSTETRSGSSTPPLDVLNGQKVLNAGVLAQEATAGADSTSAACAGLAGNGGSVVQIGDSSCLTPGTPVNATLGSLDLNDLVVADPASALAPLNQVTEPILTQLAGPISDAVAQVRAQFGDLGLVAGFGAVEGRCTAQLGSADGDAILADAQVSVVLPEQAPQRSVVLLDLPLHPKPNTHLTTNLSDVLDMIAAALTTNLNSSIDGAGAPLNALVDAFQENIVTAVRNDVEANLAPLEQNLLDVTLNRQTRTGDDAIKVRALDLSLLPVAQQQLGAPLVNLQIGNAACGPSGRIAAVAAPAASAAPAAIPTGVSAGYESVPTQYADPGDSSTNTVVLGAFALLVATSAGWVAFRRLRA